MKLIHCADLHLDSRLQAHLDRRQARRRRDELLRNFARLADYAEENGVEAVLIAGDLFDRDTVSALARNIVLAVIRAHPGIRFYYLRGNHDRGDCLGSGLRDPGAEMAAEDPPSGRMGTGNARAAMPAGSGRCDPGAEMEMEAGAAAKAGDASPDNLFFFDTQWKTYREGDLGRIAVTGLELPDRGGGSAAASLRLDPDAFNIVLLHGQDPEDFRLRRLCGKGIDYLALGHLHAFRAFRLDARGVCCYPGCLEGRGFDECGPHGFALLEIDEERQAMTHRFIPFAQRTFHALEVDVTGCLTTAQMHDLVEDALRDAGCAARDMVDVRLIGELDLECEKDAGYLRSDLEARFFFARLQDRTALRIDPGQYLYDESLRGEFVRRVMGDPSIPEEEKAAVVRCGFLALDGEEL